MRLLAQICMATIAGFLALFWKFSLLLPLLWPFAWVLLTPIAWYVVFDRHRETGNEELLLRLDALANAIRDAADRSATAPSSRLSAAGTVRHLSADTAS